MAMIFFFRIKVSETATEELGVFINEMNGNKKHLW